MKSEKETGSVGAFQARSPEEILADIEAINHKTQESADLLLEYIGAIRRGEAPPFRVVDDAANAAPSSSEIESVPKDPK